MKSTFFSFCGTENDPLKFSIKGKYLIFKNPEETPSLFN